MKQKFEKSQCNQLVSTIMYLHCVTLVTAKPLSLRLLSTGQGSIPNPSITLQAG